MTDRQHIYLAVLAAMQPAEEIGGPEGAEYVALMTDIADEASRRAVLYGKRLLQSKEKTTMQGTPTTATHEAFHHVVNDNDIPIDGVMAILKDVLPGDTPITYEYPGCIRVGFPIPYSIEGQHRGVPACFWFGTANEDWGGDLYTAADGEASGEIADHCATDVPSNCKDAAVIAHALLNQIAMRQYPTFLPDDEYVCTRPGEEACSNTASASGFHPVNMRGEYVDPTPRLWPVPLYKCDECGYITIFRIPAEHGTDKDCIPFLLDDTCTVCGVVTGDPCKVCGGARYHDGNCPNIQALEDEKLVVRDSPRSNKGVRMALEVLDRIVRDEILDDLHDSGDTREEEVRDALDVLKSILAQKGCEHLEGNGTLTSLMDVVIYG